MIGKIRFLNLKSCLKKCFHLNSYSSAFIIRAALTQTIIILINILTRHELPLKDVVLNKFPLFFLKFSSYPSDKEHLTHKHRYFCRVESNSFNSYLFISWLTIKPLV